MPLNENARSVPSPVWLYTTSNSTSMPFACRVLTMCLNSFAAACGPAPSLAYGTMGAKKLIVE